jgi:hypothetical protein
MPVLPKYRPRLLPTAQKSLVTNGLEVGTRRWTTEKDDELITATTPDAFPALLSLYRLIVQPSVDRPTGAARWRLTGRFHPPLSSVSPSLLPARPTSAGGVFNNVGCSGIKKRVLRLVAVKPCPQVGRPFQKRRGQPSG